MNDSRPPKPKLRWYQFSLRTLLLFVLAAGIGLGWIGRRMLQARNHSAAVVKLQKSGATITFDENGWAKTVEFPYAKIEETTPVLDDELIHFRLAQPRFPTN